MYFIGARRVFIPAVVLVLAACGGNAGLPGSTTASVAGAGTPFTTGAGKILRRNVQATYPTKKSLVFEADIDTYMVNVYKTKNLANNPAPIVSFPTKSGCPDGLAMDKTGALYVADECGGNDIEEFPKGSTTPETIITGISDPSGLTIDKDGTLYVSTYPASIEEFAYGTTTPSKTITGQGLTDPFGLALDASDNLYVADFGAHQVFEIPYGTTTVNALNLSDLTEPLGVAIDLKTNDLWVTDGEGNRTQVYHLGSTTPIETIPGNGFPYAASAQQKGAPKGTVVTSDTSADAVYAFKSASYTPYATLTNGVGDPISVLIAKP
jgi:sugar lactone lactonase YvrE